MIPCRLSAGIFLKMGLAFLRDVCYYIRAVKSIAYPGVAKFGIALEWGSRGRWFESSHSDQGRGKRLCFPLFLLRVCVWIIQTGFVTCMAINKGSEGHR